MFRALIIDHNITQANLTAKAIKDLQFGATLKYALSAAQAILYLVGIRSARMAMPDLILMSADLPDAKGPALLRSLLNATRHEQVPIVVIAGGPESGTAAGYSQLGATACVTRSHVVRDYLRSVADTVAFMAMAAGLVPKQARFFPPEMRTGQTISDVLQVHL